MAGPAESDAAKAIFYEVLADRLRQAIMRAKERDPVSDNAILTSKRRWTDAQIHAARGLVYIAQRTGEDVEPFVKEVAELPTKRDRLVS